jgi:hypothetical protein
MMAWVRAVCIGSAASLVLSALACGSKGGDDSAAATGGTGGAAHTGGTGGTGTVGGGSGGTTPIAGTSAGGASAGTTGVAGTGGGTAVTKSYNFDADVETWKVQYTSSGVLPGDAGTAPIIAPADVMLSWFGTDGDPATPPGAIQVNIPYTTASQYVGIGVSLAVGVDLTGKVITANVKVMSGLGSATDLMTNPGGAKLYAKSGAGYIYAAGTYTNVSVIGTWIPIRFDLTDPSFVDMTNDAGAFNPADIREIGIQFDTSGTSTTPQAAVDLVDSVAY